MFSLQNFVLLFSDGASNMRVNDTISEAIDLRVSGARVVTMSVGTLNNLMELIGTASAPTDLTVITTTSFNTISSMVETAVSATCNGG